MPLGVPFLLSFPCFPRELKRKSSIVASLNSTQAFSNHQHRVIAFLCLSMALMCSATRKEDLERAAELAVEKAAERVAERAVEKALESSNSTTETKTVRDSHSSARKVPYRESSEGAKASGRYTSTEDEGEQEDDTEDWGKHSRTPKSRSFRRRPSASWSSKMDDSGWSRFPRSGLPEGTLPWEKPKVITIEKKVPVPVTVEKRIPYPVYKHVPVEVQVPVPQPYMVEKKVPYPVKVFVNVPVEVPQPYVVEKQVPYEVKVDRPVPYKVEVPVPQPYTVEKKIDPGGGQGACTAAVHSGQDSALRGEGAGQGTGALRGGEEGARAGEGRREPAVPGPRAQTLPSGGSQTLSGTRGQTVPREGQGTRGYTFPSGGGEASACAREGPSTGTLYRGETCGGGSEEALSGACEGTGRQAL